METAYCRRDKPNPYAKTWPGLKDSPYEALSSTVWFETVVMAIKHNKAAAWLSVGMAGLLALYELWLVRVPAQWEGLCGVGVLVSGLGYSVLAAMLVVFGTSLATAEKERYREWRGFLAAASWVVIRTWHTLRQLDCRSVVEQNAVLGDPPTAEVRWPRRDELVGLVGQDIELLHEGTQELVSPCDLVDFHLHLVEKIASELSQQSTHLSTETKNRISAAKRSEGFLWYLRLQDTPKLAQHHLAEALADSVEATAELHRYIVEHSGSFSMNDKYFCK